MFVTMPFYVIFKKIATIYERFVMARKLVEEKLSEDLQSVEVQDQISKEILRLIERRSNREHSQSSE